MWLEEDKSGLPMRIGYGLVGITKLLLSVRKHFEFFYVQNHEVLM